jgi:hypothetical protein
MKALSVVQPWAWLIVHGGKTIENRSWWRPSCRGRVLIHASGRMTLDQHHAARTFVARAFGNDAAARIPFLSDGSRELLLGGIIGAVTITGVVPKLSQPTNPWHMPGYLGWTLADPEPLPFLRCPGQLGLWGDFDVVDGKAVRR